MENHEVPQNGFPKNPSLASLLELKAKEVTQSELVRRFNKALKLVREKNDKLANDFVAGDAILRAHCDEVRREAQLAIEQAHKRLEEMHKEIFDEIDEYEKNCQAEFKALKQNKADIKTIISKANEFIIKSESLMKQAKNRPAVYPEHVGVCWS